MLSKIFTDYHKLSLGTNAKEVKDYGDFIHVKGFFDDSWYNYIVPKSENLSDKSKDVIKDIIEREKSLGVKVAYYINKDLVKVYKSELENDGYKDFGTDTYMVKNIEKKEEISFPDGYEITSKYDFDEYSSLLEKCFHEWENEDEYCKRYERYLKEGMKDREFVTYGVTKGVELVAAASLVLDKKVGLSYFHNDGTGEKHRRKGIQTVLILERCNFSFENGVNRALGLVEFESGSYWSYKKAGFEIADVFSVFSV